MKEIKRLILIVLATLPLMTAVGQPAVNKNDAPSFLERGMLMYDNDNYVGAIDQLGYMTGRLSANIHDEETAEFLKAMSAFELNDAGNLEALRDFVVEYPLSRYTPLVRLRIGDYHFYRGNYAEAIDAYADVPDNALDLDLDEDWRYRTAYCYLQTEQWQQARALYNELAQTRRYGDASLFYQAYIDYAKGDYNTALDEFMAINRTGELGYQAQYYIAQIYFAQGDYNKVIDLGNSLLEDDANDYFTPELHRLVGESYYRGGSVALAKGHLTEYMNTTEDPVVRSAAYTLGVINYDEHNLDAAAACMNQVAGDYDDALSQSAYLYLGQCHLEKKDMNKAAMAFERAAHMHHDEKVRETACYNYAISQSQGGRTPFNNSIDLFEQFLNDYPTSPHREQVDNYLYSAYLTTTDYDRALTSINHIKQPGKKVLEAKQNVLYNLGVQALSNDDNKKAEQYFTEAIALGNLDKNVYNDCHLWLGEAQYRNGDYSKALKNQQTYISNVKKGDDNYAIAQYNYGYSLYQQRKYAEARQAFQNAVADGKLDKDLLADAYNRLGDTHYYTQDFAGADNAYRQAGSLDNNKDADYSLYQRALMAGEQKKPSEQISLLDALMQQYPNSAYVPAALLQKSTALVDEGRNGEAVTVIDMLAKQYPETAEARHGMLQKAIIYRNTGETDKAVKAYRAVVTTYPTSDEAQAAVDDLKVIAAERGELADLSNFLGGVKGAPQLDVNETERLVFEAAERVLIEENAHPEKMEAYLKQYPAGAYVGKAHYYLGRYYYGKGQLDRALNETNIAIDMGDDAPYAEDALAIKSDILVKQGKGAEAIEVYRSLEAKASTQDNKIIARLGLMRAAKQAKKWKDAAQTATALLNDGGLKADEEKEARLTRAIANTHLNNVAQAQSDLEELAKDTRNEYGAQAAYQLALLKYNAGNLAGAEATLNKFTEEGTPHHYWLAKGFILLCDVYYKQNKTQDAIDLLTSLKSNYPGKEGEIFNEIDERLGKWKKGKNGKK